MSNELVSRSPADPKDEIGRFRVADASAVDAAVERARAAFPAWRDAGFEARAAVLRRFRDRAAERKQELAELISREMGKALWDAQGEAGLLPAKVDVTLGEGMRFVAPIEAGGGARAAFHPRGVLTVLGPFNFPAHLPNGHIVPALATGNTLVFKPSELTPAVGDWMVRVWREAGLPAGVLEIAQGGAETGRALTLHPEVDGILFTGSWSVGQVLRDATVGQPQKILALEMGGKNAMIVCEDADLDLAAAEATLSLAATTGQRCSCLSRIFVARSVRDAFEEKLAGLLGRLVVGPPLEAGVFMGPLASLAAHEKVLRYRRLAADSGGERIALPEPGREAPYIGPGLVRFASLDQSHPYAREEIFGPEAGTWAIDDLDEGIAAVNESEYGLAASLMSRDRAQFERCVGRVQTGILNWNRGTIGASGKLPFGGRGKSGNDRPAGILASIYCTVAQAHIENPEGALPAFPPGMSKP